MNGEKTRKIRKMLVNGNKQLLDALTQRYGKEVMNQSFKSLFRKSKKIYKDLKANKPI